MIMTSLEQAKFLQRRIRQAMKSLSLTGNERIQITESEVMFRFEALAGILIIANNDVSRMVRVWEDDDELSRAIGG